MIFKEILNEIKNKENNALNTLEKSKEVLELRKVLDFKSLVLYIEVKRSGSLINNNYYSQICLTIYDKFKKDVFLNDEPNMSMETFSEIVVQNKNKLNLFDIDEDIDFWESLHLMIDNILNNNFHVN